MQATPALKPTHIPGFRVDSPSSVTSVSSPGLLAGGILVAPIAGFILQPQVTEKLRRDQSVLRPLLVPLLLLFRGLGALRW